MGHVSKTPTIPGLREAIAAEWDEADRRDAIGERLKQAQEALTGAAGKRKALIAKATAGDGVTPQETRAVEDSAREAESQIAVYTEALAGADDKVRAAENKVSRILRAELEARSAKADADEMAAQQAYAAAQQAFRAASERALMARNLATIDGKHVRQQFRAEIEACEVALVK